MSYHYATAQRNKAIHVLLQTRQIPLVNQLYYRYVTLQENQTTTLGDVEDAVLEGFWVATCTDEWNPSGERPMALVSKVARRALLKTIHRNRRFIDISRTADDEAPEHTLADKSDPILRLYTKGVIADLRPREVDLTLEADDEARTNAEHQAIHRMRRRIEKKHGKPNDEGRSR